MITIGVVECKYTIRNHLFFFKAEAATEIETEEKAQFCTYKLHIISSILKRDDPMTQSLNCFSATKPVLLQANKLSVNNCTTPKKLCFNVSLISSIFYGLIGILAPPFPYCVSVSFFGNSIISDGTFKIVVWATPKTQRDASFETEQNC